MSTITKAMLPRLANPIFYTEGRYILRMHLGSVGGSQSKLVQQLGWKFLEANGPHNSTWGYETRNADLVRKCYKLGFPCVREAAIRAGLKKEVEKADGIKAKRKAEKEALMKGAESKLTKKEWEAVSSNFGMRLSLVGDCDVQIG